MGKKTTNRKCLRSIAPAPTMPGHVLAIDPGNSVSAMLVYNTATQAITHHGIYPNFHAAELLREADHLPDPLPTLAIEMVACYGMPVGREVFDTCVWIGRLVEAYGGGEYVYRSEVKGELCRSMRAKDSNIRQAIIDRYEPTGGGAKPQIGTKKQPGPLYGIKSHLWAALGVAITFTAAKQRELDAWERSAS